MVSNLTLPGSVEVTTRKMPRPKVSWLTSLIVASPKIGPRLPIRSSLRRLIPPMPKKASQLSQEGWQQWAQQNYSGAATKFEEAVKLDPRNSNAWNGLGWASFSGGKNDRAREAFLAVLKLEPKHPAAPERLGANRACGSQVRRGGKVSH